MSIRYDCTCGVRMKLPDGTGGKKTRCPRCGVVFRIPQPAAPVRSSPVAVQTQVVRASPGPSVCNRPPVRDKDDGLIPLEPFEHGGVVPRFSSPVTLPHTSSGRNIAGTQETTRPFWADLVLSFGLAGRAGNWVTFGFLVVISILFSYIPVFGVYGLLVKLGLAAYFCGIYMSTVLDTAGGEDDLPSLGFRNWWDDLLSPAVQFVGTAVIALFPALILAGAALVRGDDALMEGAKIVGVLGGLIWPVTLLCVAVGGTLRLNPYKLLRTALAAPLPYAAICLGILVAAAASYIPETGAFVAWVQALPLIEGLLIKVFVAHGLDIYSKLVAMRIIGLYYRHFKDRFPWTAE